MLLRAHQLGRVLGDEHVCRGGLPSWRSWSARTTLSFVRMFTLIPVCLARTPQRVPGELRVLAVVDDDRGVRRCRRSPRAATQRAAPSPATRQCAGSSPPVGRIGRPPARRRRHRHARPPPELPDRTSSPRSASWRRRPEQAPHDGLGAVVGVADHLAAGATAGRRPREADLLGPDHHLHRAPRHSSCGRRACRAHNRRRRRPRARAERPHRR